MNRLPKSWRQRWHEREFETEGDLLKALGEMFDEMRADMSSTEDIPLVLKKALHKMSQDLSRKLLSVPVERMQEVIDRETPKMIKKYDKLTVEYLTKEWGKRQ